MAVFLSYASADTRHLTTLVSALRLGRVDHWYDDELRVGTEWWQEILRQIRLCDVLVVVISQNWAESAACRMELGYARSLGKPILAVRTGGDDSAGAAALGGLEVVDFRKPDSTAGVELITAVRAAEVRAGPLPDPLPPEPDVPFAYLQKAHSLITVGQITAQNQTQALEELKAALQGDGGHQHARGEVIALLARLRDHPDVTQRVRNEILGLSGMPAPSASGERRRWMKWAAATVVVVLVATATALFLWKPWQKPSPGMSLVQASQLRTLLLSTEEADRIMVTANMQALDVNPNLREFEESGDSNCVGAVRPGAVEAYADSGWDSAANQTIATTNPDNSIEQSVVGFHNPDEAKRFLGASRDRWSGCAGQVVALPDAGEMPTSYMIEPVTPADSRLTLYFHQIGTEADYCQHSLLVVSNVALEAVACAQRIDDEGVRAVDLMAAKLPVIRPGS